MSFEDDLLSGSSLAKESADRKRELEKAQRERAAATKRVNLFVLGAVASCLIGVIALFVGVGFYYNLAGYFFGTLVTVLLVAYARRAAAVAEMDLGVGSSSGMNGLMVGLIAAALVLAIVHSYFMARHGF